MEKQIKVRRYLHHQPASLLDSMAELDKRNAGA
jgi:hypothetical protein